MARLIRKSKSIGSENIPLQYITLGILDSLSGEEKELIILKKIDEIIKSNISENYHFEFKDQDEAWIDLILRIASLNDNIGISVCDCYEIDSVLFNSDTTELIWHNMGRFKILTSFFLRNAPKIKIKGNK